MTGTCCDAINTTQLLSFRRRAKRRRRNLLLGLCLEAAPPSRVYLSNLDKRPPEQEQGHNLGMGL
jgi:hypothetical protein